MPEIARATPAAISDLTGTWALDPRRTTIQFQTKAMWVLNVNGTLRGTEGSGAVDGNGQVTGRLVVDANSIDTKNKRRGKTPVTTMSGTRPAGKRSPPPSTGDRSAAAPTTCGTRRCRCG
jgi:polyisoprenoid-binding protein YceI